jgi:hypothetical protein
MSINKILDITQSNTSNKIRVWDLTIDNNVSFPTGSIQPSDIAIGSSEDILVTKSGVAQWTGNISPTNITFNQLAIPQTALNCYAETGNIQLGWSAPSSLSGSVFAKYIRIGNLVTMSIQSSFGGLTSAAGTWSITGIPTYCRPSVARTTSMPFAYQEVSTPNTFKAQPIILINTDGTGEPFGAQGTYASGGNTISYAVPVCCISWSII